MDIRRLFGRRPPVDAPVTPEALAWFEAEFNRISQNAPSGSVVVDNTITVMALVVGGGAGWFVSETSPQQRTVVKDPLRGAVLPPILDVGQVGPLHVRIKLAACGPNPLEGHTGTAVLANGLAGGTPVVIVQGAIPLNRDVVELLRKARGPVCVLGTSTFLETVPTNGAARFDAATSGPRDVLKRVMKDELKRLASSAPVHHLDA